MEVFMKLLLPLLTFAADPALMNSTAQVPNVEQLLSTSANYVDRKIIVSGKIDARLDDRALILESGDYLGDEIVVVLSPAVPVALAAAIPLESSAQVTGVLRMAPLRVLRNELNWAPSARVQNALEDTQLYLVADDIRSNP